MTPNVETLRTSLFGRIVPIEWWLSPPVPTVKKRMPLASAAPVGPILPKRS